MLPSTANFSPLVGYARTAKIAGLAPPNDPPDIIRERRLDYFRFMAADPSPAIAVIEDLDYPSCIAGWWGAVNVAVHRGLGLKGAVTNGVMRDLDEMVDDFPILAGSIGPSHGYVHVVEMGTPVNILGMHVNQNDIIHADRHGCIVVPKDVLPDLQQAVTTVLENEAIILKPANAPDFSLEKLEAAWKEFESKRL